MNIIFKGITFVVLWGLINLEFVELGLYCIICCGVSLFSYF